MLQYALRRTLNAIPILIGITIISFLIIHMAPGGPLSAIAEDPTVKASDVANMMKAYGLDQPLYVQYWNWIKGMVQGDFGMSFMKNEPVGRVILEYLPNTLLLTISSFIISMLVAFPLGILCALKPNSKFDQIVSSFTFVGLAIPGFWLGLLLIMLFGITLHWLPTGGLRTINAPFSLWDRIQHLILPITCLIISEIPVWTRHIRSSMLEVINQDYIRTARAKGMEEKRVLFLHTLRNGLIPIATLFGLSLAGFFGGSLIIESIYSIPGIGRLFIEAAFQRDYPVLFTITTITAFLNVLGSILADLSYAILDPRVSYSKKEAKV